MPKRDVFSQIFEATYTIINHDIVKKFDLVTAYWLCEMMSWMQHLREKDRLDEDGWFYYCQNHLEKKIGVSCQRQNRIIKKLKSVSIMEVQKRGMPAKNYYRINYEKLAIYIYGDILSSIKTIELDLLKQEIYNNINNNITHTNSSLEELGATYSKNKKKLRPSYFRFTSQIQQKQKNNYPNLFKQYSTEQLKKQIDQGAEVLDQLVRLDRWDFCNDIKPAIEWAIKDDFWSFQIRGLTRLRAKGKNGETKFTNIFSSWESWKKDQNKKPKPKFEDPRNPSRPELVRGADGIMRWSN